MAPLDNKKKKATEQLVGVVKDMMEQVPLAKRPAVRNALREVQKDLHNKPGSDAKPRLLSDVETQIRRPPASKQTSSKQTSSRQTSSRQPGSLLPTPSPASAIAQSLKIKRVENELQRVQKAYDKEKEKSAARTKAKLEKLL